MAEREDARLASIAAEVRALAAQRNGMEASPPATLPAPPGWPDPPAAAVFDGLPGEFVKIVGPHTEADPVALLGVALVMAGSAIGGRPYVWGDGARHHVNEFVCLVGDTAKARKGTATGHARRAVVAADPDWEQQIASGLSSGEGLIYAVRDQKTTTDENGEEKIVDEGVSDKRLLAIEEEFASVLKVASREGNTVSALLRQAWDAGTLRTLTRRDPLRATGAHISVVGHITQTELLRHLSETEIANGLANRFVFLCVRRSRLLPEGGRVPEQQLREWTTKLAHAIDKARRLDEVGRDEPMRALWEAEYERLSKARIGLVGALLARAEAHTLRLALLHALLDSSPVICEPHLRAAITLWRYAEQSVIYLFGDSTGNPDADTIMRALRANKRLTRTEISALFGRHRTAAQIDRALALLLEQGLARMETEPTGGRSTEVWYAT